MGQPGIVPPIPKQETLEAEDEFSLALGGPLYQLYLRIRLARPPVELLVRRILIISMICWFPLLLLSGIGGHLIRGVAVPFLRDPEVHIRFLLALPLLIAAEVFMDRRMRLIVPQFVSRGLIAPQDHARFQQTVASAVRLRDSVVAEIILLALVLTLGYWVWSESFTLTMSTWYRDFDNGVPSLTTAGHYYAFVSLTAFRFILLRWYFRLFIWYRFLWKVSAMPLHFNLFHPDRTGGLGFLTTSVEAFTPVFMAQTMVVAGNIFAHVLFANESLPSFRMQIGGILVFAVLTLVFPLGFFAVRLAHAGRLAKLEMGNLASHYVEDFHRKWIAEAGRGEPLLGSSDIQSLADMANSFSVVAAMRLLPVNKETLIRMVVLVGLPFLPLVLTMFPLDELIRRLFKLAF